MILQVLRPYSVQVRKPKPFILWIFTFFFLMDIYGLNQSINMNHTVYDIDDNIILIYVFWCGRDSMHSGEICPV